MFRTSALLALMALAVSVWAMPPAPGVKEGLQRAGMWDYVVTLHQEGLARGINAPFDFDLNQLRRDGRDLVEIRALVLLADFNDNEAQESVEHYQQMLFSRDEYQGGSMRDYYLENSYGQIDLTGDVFGWYRMQEDYPYYVDSSYGFGGNYPRNAQGLVAELMQAANNDVDYSQYDNNDNSVVEALLIVHAGRGAETMPQEEGVNYIWSHSAGVPDGLRLDGMRFRSYAMEPEDGTIGVFGHELGHSLFGLPDLYDYTYTSSGVGMWSMMAAGSWGGGGARPVHFDAWSKVQMGIIEPYPVMENTKNLQLLPCEQVDDVVLVWTHGAWQSQYFLLENRQRVGFDQSLPGSGLLIWHVDESMSNNNNAWRPDSGGSQHYLVALEQADGSYDMEKYQNDGDGGDPFPGDSGNPEFGADTQPSSRDYYGMDTDVSIYNIEAIKDTIILCDVDVFPGPGAEGLHLFVLQRIPEDHLYPDPDRADTVMISEVSLFTRLLDQIGAPIDSMGSELPENILDYNVVIYLESWRTGDQPEGGLTFAEQESLVNFLEAGNKLMLVGPDVAANLQGDNNPLWPYMMADFRGDGNPMETGNIRRLTANTETRISGKNFPIFKYKGACDHYVDNVGPVAGSEVLFTDQNDSLRGVIGIGEGGYRIILQPFLFGGLKDWGGRKADLLRLYFEHLRFYFQGVGEDVPSPNPQRFELLSAWPNPFNGVLSVAYRGGFNLPRVNVFDILGQKVGEIEGGGAGRFTWMPKTLGSGSYYLLPEGVAKARPIRVVYLR